MTRLEQLRIDRGLTIRALAIEARVSPQTILNIESGKPALAPTLHKIARVFGEHVRASSLSQPATFNNVAPTEPEAA